MVKTAKKATMNNRHKISRDSIIVGIVYIIFFYLIGNMYSNKDGMRDGYFVVSIWHGWYYFIGAFIAFFVTLKDLFIKNKMFSCAINIAMFLLLLYFPVVFVAPLLPW